MLFSPLAAGDIAEVMRIERLPGYEAFVGRCDAAEHAAQLGARDTRYFGTRDGLRAGETRHDEAAGPALAEGDKEIGDD